MPIITQFEPWYNQTNFYSVELANGNHVYWWTELSYDEAKQKIADEAFVVISSNEGKEISKEYNTKAIITIKDITESERARHKHNSSIKKSKRHLVREIRSKKMPLMLRLELSSLCRNSFEKRRFNSFDDYMEIDKDPLLSLEIFQLKKILKKCK